MTTHIKEYNNIAIPYDHFTKKILMYANPTSQPKTVRAQIDSSFVKLKES
jgi:hypothetical protein